MKAGGGNKAGMGRRSSKGTGTVGGAIRFAMNPVGFAASEIRKDIQAKRKQKAGGGRMMYGHGGEVTMEGTQPKYKGTPKCMPN